ALRDVVCLLARHARDRMRHARGTRLLIGNALIARALHTALRLGIHIETHASLSDLDVVGGRVVGATIRTPQGTRALRARRGVVLATGGFPHAPALRQELAPHHPHSYSLASEE